MESLKKKTELYKRIQITLAGGFAIALAGFYLFMDRPGVARLGGLLSQIEMKKHELVLNQNKADGLNPLTRELAKLEAQVKLYDRQFPRQPELGPFIKDLTQISQSLSLREWKYQPGAPRKTDSHFEMPILMHFEGDFLNVASFLRQIEDLPRLTRVWRVSMKSKPGDAGVVEVDMTMNIYFAEG
jgi:Tfp pilus assembly protein PilO